jgi:hypothetical protein
VAKPSKNRSDAASQAPEVAQADENPPKATDSQAVPRSFGVPMEDFRAATEVLAALRDEGKYLIFLGARTSIRFIGSLQRFQEAFAAKLGGTGIDLARAERALEEVRRDCAALEALRSVAGTVEVLTGDGPYSDRRRKGVKKDEIELLRGELTAKIELVESQILTEEVKRRRGRLNTATTPCLEDVDVEVISERVDTIRGEKLADPFVRLRLRYWNNSKSDLYSIFSMPAWGGGPPPQGLDSFEFEGDEADMDLLLLRLLEAKQLIAEQRERFKRGKTDDK